MRILGLDLGVNSVGWALLDDGIPVKLGVYVSPESAERENGLYESYRRKRGQKRRQRRLLRRKSQRRNQLLRLIVASGMLPSDKKKRTEMLCSLDPYILRKKGLDEELTPEEFGRCLYHLCRRRAYLSIAALNVKILGLEVKAPVPEQPISDESDEVVDEKEQKKRKEEGRMLARINEVRQMLKNGKARTIGELYADIIAQGGWKAEDGKVVWVRGKQEKYEIEPEKAIEKLRLKWAQVKEHYKIFKDDLLEELCTEINKLSGNDEEKKLDKSKFDKSWKKVAQPYKEKLNNDENEKLDELKKCFVEELFPPQTRDPLGFRAERQMLEDEFHLLWDKQAKYKPSLLTPSLREKIHNAIFYQRPLKNQKFLVGHCQFFPQKKRAPRALPLSQRFSIVQTLVNLTLIDEDGEKRRLKPEEIKILADELEKRDALTWKEVKELIHQSDKAYFTDEPIKKGRAKNKSGRGKEKLEGDRTAIVMRKALKEKWNNLDDEQKNDLVTRLITCREFRNIAEGLKRDFSLDDDELSALASANLPEGYMNLSVKAIRLLLPRMEEGRVYSEACEDVGLREKGKSTETRIETPLDKLPFVTNLNNPVVEQSVNAAIRVINTVIEQYGKPDVIRIEMPRDVSRTNKQRMEIYKEQDKRAKVRANAKKLLEENKLSVNETNIKKVLLWQEANMTCPYEPGRQVSINELINDYDIDHIVPRSRCYEDGWHNLTICPNRLNAVKSSRTPFEAWGGTPEWEHIKKHVNGLRSMQKNKRDRILRETWEDIDFNERALTDTRYISKKILTEVKKLGVKVTVSRGQITSLLRNLWEADSILPPRKEEQKEMEKWLQSAQKKQEKPRFDHRHHALDALLTALTDVSTLQSLTRYFQEQESGKPRKKIPKPKPWSSFVEDVRNLIEECPIVYQPTRGIHGPLHEETARKPPPQDEVEEAISKLPEKIQEELRSGKRKCLIVGTQLVCLDDEGKAYKAYNLGSNHHCIIWESLTPNRKGKFERDITVVPMMEASRRAQMDEQVFQREKPGWRYVMSLCLNDIVEWKREDGQLELRRVSTLFESRKSKAFEITLSPLKNARKVMKDNIRVRSRKDLFKIVRRVCLNPIGEEISSEPPR